MSETSILEYEKHAPEVNNFHGVGVSDFESIAPETEQPVRVIDIMKKLDLEFLKPVLDDLYSEDWRFKFDPIPVLKTIIYWRLKGHRFLSEVHNDLITDSELANVLGYDLIPSYKSLYHFVTYRLNHIGTKKIFDSMLKKVKQECKDKDIELGREVILDSSPMEKKNNDDATYNGHYGIKGYKWHNLICLNTQIPLDYHVSNATEYDGDLFAPLIYRLKNIHNIHPKRAFVDGAYSDGKNLMRMREFFNIEVVTNVEKNWKLHPKATVFELIRQYQRMWKSELFKVDAGIDYIKYFMMMYDETKIMEQFYHNQILKEFYKDPEKYIKKYLVRGTIERCHGWIKRHTEIKNIQATDIHKFTAHLGFHLISTLALALVRLQDGKTEGLINRGGLI